MDIRVFTEAQIKAAFWAEFHEAGERWFGYLGSEKENEGHTQAAWEIFKGELDKRGGIDMMYIEVAKDIADRIVKEDLCRLDKHIAGLRMSIMAIIVNRLLKEYED